jgi:hypothetical protein
MGDKINFISRDPETVIIILIVVLIGLILFLRFYFSRKAIVKRKLKKAAGKSISGFVNGEIAKVVGKVVFAGEPLISPFSKRKCAYYYVLVERKVSSGGKGHHWETIVEEEVAGRFLIRDGNSYAHVNCKNVKSYIVQDKFYTSGFLADASEELERYLNNHGEKSEGLLGLNKTLRYKEGILEKGEMIAALGVGEWKKASDLELTDSFGYVLEINSSEKMPVYLSDDPETVERTYNQDDIAH